jgi:hypothetical protein
VAGRIPWYRRSVGRRIRLIDAAFWIPGVLLALLAENLLLRLIGLALMFAGAAAYCLALLRAEGDSVERTSTPD